VNTIGIVLVARCNPAVIAVPWARITSVQLRHCSPNAACVLGIKAKLDPDVAILSPSKLLQGRSKCRDVELALRISFRKTAEHRDPPNLLGLLRMRRKRPRGRSSEQPYQLTPFQFGLHMLPMTA
jgi:hypothetical protein